MASEINSLRQFFTFICAKIRLKNIMLLAYIFFEYNTGLLQFSKFNARYACSIGLVFMYKNQPVIQGLKVKELVMLLFLW